MNIGKFSSRKKHSVWMTACGSIVFTVTLIQLFLSTNQSFGLLISVVILGLIVIMSCIISEPRTLNHLKSGKYKILHKAETMLLVFEEWSGEYYKINFEPNEIDGKRYCFDSSSSNGEFLIVDK